MISFAISDRMARDADPATRLAMAQSLLDEINALAFRDGERGATLESVTLADRPDGTQRVTVEGVAGPRPATMEDFREARRRGRAGGA